MIELHNIDCMELMKRYPDDYFDLAIVDPPYGINITKQSGFGTLNRDKSKNWDCVIPNGEYFVNLKKVSKNQIVWGGNYFLAYLDNTKCFLSWDKMNGTNDMADFELAWTSFDRPCRKFSMHHFSFGYGKKIHPTQKPIALYRWILDNYAKQGDRILDTHLGSGSSAIAAYQLGYDFVGCELDKDYFKAMQKRVKQAMKQTNLFQSVEEKQAEQIKIF